MRLDFTAILALNDHESSLVVVLAIEDLGTQYISCSSVSALTSCGRPLVCLICLILSNFLIEGVNELFCSGVQKLAVMINLVDAWLSFHFSVANDVKRSTLNSLQLL